MLFDDWPQFPSYILQQEQAGRVRRTFRRLDPQRQQAVIGAILEEAAQAGPASLSIKRVARLAGVSVGSLYQYFPDRLGMLDFAVDLCVRYVADSFSYYRPYLMEMPLREALSAYLVGGVEWGQTLASLIKLFARAAYQGDTSLSDSLVLPIANQLLEMVREMLAKADERGELRPGVDLEASARLIHALIIAVGDSQLLPYLNTYFQVIEPSQPPERTLNAFLDLILKGIGKEDE